MPNTAGTVSGTDLYQQSHSAGVFDREVPQAGLSWGPPVAQFPGSQPCPSSTSFAPLTLGDPIAFSEGLQGVPPGARCSPPVDSLLTLRRSLWGDSELCSGTGAQD